VDRILRGISGIRHPTLLRQIHEQRKGGACSTSGRDVKCIQNCGRKTWRYTGCGDENCKITLNRIEVWGFRRDSFGSAQFRAAGACKDGIWNVKCQRMRETSWICLNYQPFSFSRTNFTPRSNAGSYSEVFVSPEASRHQCAEKEITNMGCSFVPWVMNTNPPNENLWTWAILSFCAAWTQTPKTSA